MVFRRRITQMAVIGAALISTLGCSSSSTPGVQADLPHMNDIQAASPSIQTAARAVVRVRTARQVATGSFISATGQLLTNNHVLGNSVCPAEGCYVEITFMHQRGQAPQQPIVVFAKPVAVDVGLDMAVAQLYYQPGGAQLPTPDYLTFNPQTPAALIGKHVTVVGHPEGFLKKWTDGVVSGVSGEWFETTAYILPGDSGSPVLDDDGRIVGLIHRGPTAQDLFTNDGANEYSIGTASAPIVAAMTAPLPSTVISVAAPTTADDFLANDLVYLNAHAATVNVGGTSASALSLLGSACDSALARNDFMSPDDLQNALAPCYHAQTWIDCRADAPAVPFGVVCPSGSEATAWKNRFMSANQLWLAMNGQLDYYSVSFAVAHLQPTMSAGTSAGAQNLQLAAAASTPVLDPVLAYYLAAFNVSSFDNTDIRSYVINYQNVPHYELDGTYFVSAGDWLYNNRSLDKNGLLTLLSGLYSDPDASVGTKLSAEDSKYQLGAL
jgi:S1-C subfamily serine protease